MNLPYLPWCNGIFLLMCVSAFMNSAQQNDVRVEELCKAALTGSLRDVHKLVKNGAPVHCKDSKDKWTPLMHALHRNDGHAIVRYLLDHGAHPNSSGPIQPLAIAVNHEDYLNCRSLLYWKARPDAKELIGSRSVLEAIKEAETEYEKHLSEWIAPDDEDERGWCKISHEELLSVPSDTEVQVYEQQVQLYKQRMHLNDEHNKAGLIAQKYKNALEIRRLIEWYVQWYAQRSASRQKLDA